MSALPPPPRIFPSELLVFYTSHAYVKTDTSSLLQFGYHVLSSHIYRIQMHWSVRKCYWYFIYSIYSSTFISFYSIRVYGCCISSKDRHAHSSRTIEWKCLMLMFVDVPKSQSMVYIYHRFIHGISSHLCASNVYRRLHTSDRKYCQMKANQVISVNLNENRSAQLTPINMREFNSKRERERERERERKIDTRLK